MITTMALMVRIEPAMSMERESMSNQFTTQQLPRVKHNQAAVPPRAGIAKTIFIFVGIFGLIAVVGFTSFKKAVALQQRMAALRHSQSFTSQPGGPVTDTVAQIESNPTSEAP